MVSGVEATGGGIGPGGNSGVGASACRFGGGNDGSPTCKGSCFGCP